MLLSSPGYTGSGLLHSALSTGLMFHRVNGSSTTRILSQGKQFDSDTVYLSPQPINYIPFKAVNLCVLLRDPRQLCIAAAGDNEEEGSFESRLQTLLIQGGPDPEWNRSYLEHYCHISHWRFNYEELLESPMPIYRFLNRYGYAYHAELVRQEYYKSFYGITGHNHLTPEQDAEFCDSHYELMKCWGYL